MDNPTFHTELTECINSGKLSEALKTMFSELIHHNVRVRGFDNLTYLKGMKKEAMDGLVNSWEGYPLDMENPNPYAWFSQLIRCSFIGYISKQRRGSLK